MRNRKGLWFVLVLMSFYSIAYASPLESINIAPSRILNHQFDKKQGHTYILDDYSVFVVKEGSGNTIITTVLYYSYHLSQKDLAKKMVWMLEVTNAEESFIEWRKKTFHRSSYLEYENFKYPPLESQNKEIHNFSLSMIGYAELFILTYQRLKPKKINNK